LKAANLALRFALELCALVAVGYWGWATGDGLTGWLLLVAAVGAVAVVWGLFLAPRRRFDLPGPVRLEIEVLVWVAAGTALIATDHLALGVAFVVVALVSGVLNYAWS
jgi:hypothetical protein